MSGGGRLVLGQEESMYKGTVLRGSRMTEELKASSMAGVQRVR